MSEQEPDRTQPGRRPDGSEIPRRGYDRRRDQTGSLRTPGQRPPAQPPADEPPVYQTPMRNRPPGPRPGTPQPPYRGRRGRRQQRAPRDSGLYLPWWSLVIMILAVGGAAVGLLFLALNLSGASLTNQEPQVIVVTGQLQQPTAVQGQAGPPTAIATFQPTLAPNVATAAPSRTPLPGGCLLNQEVIVFGTGGVGLNLRDEPGGEVAFIAREGDRMLVIDGPVFFDDVQWCQVRSTSQSSSFGWASLEFLLAADVVDEQAEEGAE